jgi:hypothetical protein
MKLHRQLIPVVVSVRCGCLSTATGQAPACGSLLGFFPVGQKFLDADIRQRMFGQLHDDAVGDGADVSTDQSGFKHMQGTAHRGNDNFRIESVIFKNGQDLL